METNDYIAFSFRFQKLYQNAIWCKRTEELVVFNTESTNDLLNSDGVYLINTVGTSFVGVMNPSDLDDGFAIENINPEDNPILVLLEVKSCLFGQQDF